MAKFFVTGALGFIGFNLVVNLAQQNHEVIGIDSLNTTLYPKKPRLEKLKQIKGLANLKIYTDDLLKTDLLKSLSGVTHVIHLAAIPGLLPSWTKTDEYFKNNTLATYRLAKCISKSSTIKSAVFASTSSVYGKVAVGAENSSLNPISPYGISKLAAEHVWNSFLLAEEVAAIPTILRYFSVYGPNQRPDMAIGNFIKNAYFQNPIFVTGDGTHERSFTYIDDIINGTIAAAKQAPGGTLNLSGDQSSSIMEVLKIIEAVVGKKLNIQFSSNRKGDQLVTNGDSSLAKKIIGFESRVKLAEGITYQYDHFLTINKLQKK